jgi:hypothetical protein
VTLDESTARLYDSYELFINDTESKTHKYEINVGEPKLREMPIRD